MRHKLPYLQARGEVWEKARMRALVRDDFTCQAHKLGLCPEPCAERRLRRLHVHHIQWRSNGGTHDLANLITVCRTHHEQIHPHMAYELAMSDKVLDAPPDREL
jgi:5-methylcytosine-specific restriction endonuclease McrA